MRSISLIPLAVALVAAFCGCSQPSARTAGAGVGPGAAKVESSPAIAASGRQAAVLSLHRRTAYPDACTYGLTLTNNLPYKITDISFRFAAHIGGGVFYQQVTRNFFELDPTNSKFREITFTQIRCDQIDYIEVTDPGRCAMGKLTRYSAAPGDCIRYVDIAPTSYVRLVKK